MTLRPLFAPLRPDLDAFLFASVGAERDGVPLSMISALTRLGLDPWEEAGRLSTLGKRDAVDQLLQLIGQLPGATWPSAEARSISASLIDLLPAGDKSARPAAKAAKMASPSLHQITRLVQIVPAKMFWPIWFLLGAAAIVSMIVHGGFSIGS
jgi:hypothetical protein